eukprot:SAG11_NODE_1098_length_5875_cov_3.667936_4_plen_106_part_00
MHVHSIVQLQLFVRSCSIAIGGHRSCRAPPPLRRMINSSHVDGAVVGAVVGPAETVAGATAEATAEISAVRAAGSPSTSMVIAAEQRAAAAERRAAAAEVWRGRR